MSGRNAKECQCSAIYGAVLLCIALLLLSGCSAKPQLEPLVQVGADQFGAEGAFLTFEVQPEEDARRAGELIGSSSSTQTFDATLCLWEVGFTAVIA